MELIKAGRETGGYARVFVLRRRVDPFELLRERLEPAICGRSLPILLRTKPARSHRMGAISLVSAIRHLPHLVRVSDSERSWPPCYAAIPSLPNFLLFIPTSENPSTAIIKNVNTKRASLSSSLNDPPVVATNNVNPTAQTEMTPSSNAATPPRPRNIGTN